MFKYHKTQLNHNNKIQLIGYHVFTTMNVYFLFLHTVELEHPGGQKYGK